MRRPTLSALIGRDSIAGLSELLSHSQDLHSGLRELVISPDQIPHHAGRPGSLDILLAGAIPPNPIELLESKRMAELLDVADELYDFVIIDTPPIGVVSDAIPLVHKVDGLLVICRMGMSRRDHATRLMKRFRGLNAHILGVVVDSVKSSDTSYGYYGYYPPAQDGDGGPRRAFRGRPRSIQKR
jgi:non-specific protein-tyrosine kinase